MLSTTLWTKIFHYILLSTKKHAIDESHGINHAMQVVGFARNIYASEIKRHPMLKTQQTIIYTAAALHDMCDNKYLSEDAGLADMENYFNKQGKLASKSEFAFDIGGPYSYPAKPMNRSLTLDKCEITPNEMTVIKQIISTMSYSKVKQHGYPILGPYQHAYHIVREADLLAAYDFDRAMIYHMSHNKKGVYEAFDNAESIFQTRILRHNDDGLFVSHYAKQLSFQLHKTALQRMRVWRTILHG
jgi:hypothetical protein